MAGGGQVFTLESDQTVAIKQIMAAYTINRVGEIYLQSHLDCGAYRLAGVEFTSHQEEIARLYADLDIAAGKVEKALAEVGAPLQKVIIHADVVNLDGEPVARPKLSRV
jgi:carbonic anhydrase